jgi:hypothetical protein
MLQTYQTKIKHVPTDYLDKISKFSGSIERKLFLDSFIHDKLRAECKMAYLRQYGITARQFNAIYIQLEGKIKSLIELKSLHLVELKDKIKSLENYIVTNTEKRELLREKLVKLEKRVPFTIKFRKAVKGYRNIKFKLHQKKRKLASCKIN